MAGQQGVLIILHEQENVLTLRPSLDYLDNPEKTKQELKKEKHVESEEEEEGNEGSDAKVKYIGFCKSHFNYYDPCLASYGSLCKDWNHERKNQKGQRVRVSAEKRK